MSVLSVSKILPGVGFLPFSQRTTASSLAQRIKAANDNLAPDVRLELSGDDSVIVWLTRIDKRNALSFALMDKLIDLAHLLTTWTDVRAVILAGEGKSFSTGIDLALSLIHI